MCIFEAAPIAGIQPNLLPSPWLSVQLPPRLSDQLPQPRLQNTTMAVCITGHHAGAAELHAEPAEAGTTGLQLQTGYATVGSGQSTV